MSKSKRMAWMACSALLLVSCGEKRNPLLGGTPELAVITLESTTTELKSPSPATIKGKQDIEIRPQVAGFITKLCVDEGSLVRKGQVLFQIDPVQYEAAVRSAEAAVKVAASHVATQQITVDNKRELNRKEIISDYDLQMAENTLASAQATLAQAEAQLTSARQNLSFTQVVSPSDGVVGDIPFRVGSLVSASTQTPLTVVSDISEMYVYFSLTEKELLSLIRQSGSQQDAIDRMPAVELMLADGSAYGQNGKIETLSGVIDSNTGAVSMRATFPNPDHLLRSGGTGSVLIPSRLENILVVPQKATYEIQDKKFVYTLQPDSTVKNTEISVFALDNGRDYVVTAGLQAGERVVVENTSTLHDGMKIKPITPQASAEQFKSSLQPADK